MSNRKRPIKKHIGSLFTIISLVLVIVGLFAYLNGPIKNGIAETTYTSTTALIIQPLYFGNTSFVDKLATAPTIVLNRNIILSLEVNPKQEIQAYVINETQYALFRQAYGFSEAILPFAVNTSNYTFTPSYNVTYYIVIRNCGNETVTCNVTNSTNYNFQVFDYSWANLGLLATLIGGFFFVFSFLFGNPLYKAVRKANNIAVFKGVSNYLSKQESGEQTPWIVFGLFSVISIIMVCWLYLTSIPIGTPYPLVPLITDAIIRIGLLFFFLCALVFLVFLIAQLVFNLTNKGLLSYFGVKQGRERNVTLVDQVVKSWYRFMLCSPLSICTYIITIIMLIGLSQVISLQLSNILFFVLISEIPLTILSSYALSIQYRKTFTDNTEFEQESFFLYTGIVAGIIMGALFVAGWLCVWNLLLNRIYLITVGSSVLVSGMPQISGAFSALFTSVLMYLNSLQKSLTYIIDGILIAGFSLTLFLKYFLSPMSTLKLKLTFVSREIAIFFLTFLSTQLILQPALSLTIIISLATSITSTFMRIIWREIASPYRRCIKCHKNLSTFPKEIVMCPYCGERIS